MRFPNTTTIYRSYLANFKSLMAFSTLVSLSWVSVSSTPNFDIRAIVKRQYSRIKLLSGGLWEAKLWYFPNIEMTHLFIDFQSSSFFNCASASLSGSGLESSPANCLSPRLIGSGTGSFSLAMTIPSFLIRRLYRKSIHESTATEENQPGKTLDIRGYLRG